MCDDQSETATKRPFHTHARWVSRNTLLATLGLGVLGLLGPAVPTASAAPPQWWTPPPTELLIIVPYKAGSADPRQTDEDWVTEGQRLWHYKRNSGLGATMLTLDEINSNYVGVDEPERIKRAIHDYVTSGDIAYVMLVGGADLMPIRYQLTGYDTAEGVAYTDSVRYCADRYCDGRDCTAYCAANPDLCDSSDVVRWCPFEGYKFVPDDGYYANLWDDDDPTQAFEDWDLNDNGIFGESYLDDYRGVDGRTLHFDVAVGRAQVGSPDRFATLIDKVMAYENPVTGMETSPSSFLGLLTASNLGRPPHRDLSDYLATRGYENTLLERASDLYTVVNPDGSSSATSTPSTFMVDFINDNSPHFIGYAGNGLPPCWCEMDFAWSDAERLTNPLPGIAAAAADNTAGLASLVSTIDMPSVAVTSSTTTSRTMAEAFLGRATGGAAVYMGSVAPAPAGAMDIETRFFEALSDHPRTAGDAWIATIEGYLADNDLDTFTTSEWDPDPTHPAGGEWERAPFWGYDRMHFFGDPSLRLSGSQRWDGSPPFAIWRYAERVHVDPNFRNTRIVFEVIDAEGEDTTMRYRYRTGASWSPWLIGSEFHLPLPASPEDVDCNPQQGDCEAVVQAYSIDSSGNREETQTKTIAYYYYDEQGQNNPSYTQVTGRVVDNRGRPLTATVKLDDNQGSQQAQTDADGWYAFGQLPPGEYNLEISEAPTGYRQFVPAAAALTIVATGEPLERGFALVREDHEAPVMTQRSAWSDAIQSGCLYGLAYDDWYGDGVDDIHLAVNDMQGRWLDSQESWTQAETWFGPQEVMTLDEYLDAWASKDERAELEADACRLDADCSPHVWRHCFDDPALLELDATFLGRASDGAGHETQITMVAASGPFDVDDN